MKRYACIALVISSLLGYTGVIHSMLNFIQEQPHTNSPLMIAILKHDLQQVKDLIAQGVDVNEQSSSQFSPLMYAAHLGYSDIIEVLINAGAHVDASRASDNTTPLLQAAQSGKEETVQTLIQRGADLNHKDIYEKTSLQWLTLRIDNAYKYNLPTQSYKHIAALLLAAGALPNYSSLLSRLGDSIKALRYAVQTGDIAAVRQLIRADEIPLSIQDSTGNTLLHRAVTLPTNSARAMIVELLCHKPELITMQNRQGENPVHRAIGNSAILYFLCRIAYAKNTKSSSGCLIQ